MIGVDEKQRNRSPSHSSSFVFGDSRSLCISPPTGQGGEFMVKKDLNIDLFLTHTYHLTSEDMNLITGVIWITFMRPLCAF